MCQFTSLLTEHFDYLIIERSWWQSKLMQITSISKVNQRYTRANFYRHNKVRSLFGILLWNIVFKGISKYYWHDLILFFNTFFVGSQANRFNTNFHLNYWICFCHRCTPCLKVFGWFFGSGFRPGLSRFKALCGSQSGTII